MINQIEARLRKLYNNRDFISFQKTKIQCSNYIYSFTNFSGSSLPNEFFDLFCSNSKVMKKLFQKYFAGKCLK